MYLGEVVISTDMLEEFMTTTKSLQIRGLTKSNNPPDTSEPNKRKQSVTSTETSATKRTKLVEAPLVETVEVTQNISTERVPDIDLIPECKLDQEIKIEYVDLEASSDTQDFFCEG